MKDMQFPQQQNFWTKNEDCFPFYTDLEGLCCVIVAVINFTWAEHNL